MLSPAMSIPHDAKCAKCGGQPTLGFADPTRTQVILFCRPCITKVAKDLNLPDLEQQLLASGQVPEVWRKQFVLVRIVPDRGLCGVQPFLVTSGLVVGMTFDGLTYGYTHRYCYESPLEATRALREWDGKGDPPGEWIKEKVSGRCRVKEK